MYVHLLFASNDHTFSSVNIVTENKIHFLNRLAYKALENTLNNFWETRDIILSSLVSFIQHDIPDIHPQLVDNALRMLHSLMGHWKSTAVNPNTAHKVGFGRAKQQSRCSIYCCVSASMLQHSNSNCGWSLQYFDAYMQNKMKTLRGILPLLPLGQRITTIHKPLPIQLPHSIFNLL